MNHRQEAIDRGAKSDHQLPLVDVVANRSASKWTVRELLGRALWELSHPLFAWSPRPLWGWRRALLRAFGARVGREVHIHPSVHIVVPWNITIGDYSSVGDRVILYALGPITIAERVTISQGAHLCAGTHDYRDKTMPLLKPPIDIEKEVWICADAFIGPSVRVGARAIVGARCVALSNIAAELVMIGNPARVLRRRNEDTPP
jgi:putative colanic acid biosynthesis acetyltransferase WcaF